MKTLKALNVICALCQIIGLILIIQFKLMKPEGTMRTLFIVSIDIAGLAAIANYFISSKLGIKTITTLPAAIAGLGIIVLYTFFV